MIRFGEVESQGKWKLGESQLTVSFEAPALTKESMGLLAHYCGSCDPLPVHLPGESAPARRSITGFDRTARETTLYLAPPKTR